MPPQTLNEAKFWEWPCGWHLKKLRPRNPGMDGGKDGCSGEGKLWSIYGTEEAD